MQRTCFCRWSAHCPMRYSGYTLDRMDCSTMNKLCGKNVAGGTPDTGRGYQMHFMKTLYSYLLFFYTHFYIYLEMGVATTFLCVQRLEESTRRLGLCDGCRLQEVPRYGHTVPIPFLFLCTIVKSFIIFSYFCLIIFVAFVVVKCPFLITRFIFHL